MAHSMSHPKSDLVITLLFSKNNFIRTRGSFLVKI